MSRGIAYQLQSVDVLIFTDIPKDVSILQPRVYDAKWEQLLRNSEEGDDVWMRSVLPRYDLAIEQLIIIGPFSSSH